jgi:hypothetical protein
MLEAQRMNRKHYVIVCMQHNPANVAATRRGGSLMQWREAELEHPLAGIVASPYEFKVPTPWLWYVCHSTWIPSTVSGLWWRRALR